MSFGHGYTNTSTTLTHESMPPIIYMDEFELNLLIPFEYISVFGCLFLQNLIHDAETGNFYYFLAFI